MARIVFAALMLAGTCSAVGQQNPGDRVAERIRAATADLAGVMGVAAQIVGEPSGVFLNGDTRFPMASTYKVAIAMAVLHKVDHGGISLEQMVPIAPESLVISRPIASNFIHPGVSLSVANLLEVMIVHSDNSATDALLGLVGGPGEVTRWLRTIGIEDMRVDRKTADILRDFYGLEPGLSHLAKAVEVSRTDPGRVNAPRPDFETDPRDQATPRAMLNLLTALAGGHALSSQNTDLLLGMMGRTVTVPQRIPGLLPQDLDTARKSGTVGGVANDVGIVTLPDGRRLAMALFTKSSASPPESRDRAIAEAARILFDYYMLR